MISLPPDGRRWERKNSQSWRNPRFVQRSRRPIFFFVACILCLAVWHHSQSASLSPNRHRFDDASPNFSSMQDRRSISEHYGMPVERIQKYEPESNDEPETMDSFSDEAFGKAPKDTPIHVQDEDKLVEHTEAKEPAPRMEPDPNLPSGPEILLIPGDPIDDPRDEPQFAQPVGESLPKGPVEVQANLDPDTQKAPLFSSPDQPVKKKVIEAEPIDHLTLEEKADSLPEIIHIPFEDAIKDDVLQGWEDQWVAHASYDAKKWGKLEEIKIDFVYLCKSLSMYMMKG
jgi:hypothetical protein